jgi:hypothetical protein
MSLLLTVKRTLLQVALAIPIVAEDQLAVIATGDDGLWILLKNPHLDL